MLSKLEKFFIISVLTLAAIAFVAMAFIVPEFYTALFSWPFAADETVAIAAFFVAVAWVFRKDIRIPVRRYW